MKPASKINLWITYSLLGVFFILLVLVGSFYFHYQSTETSLENTPTITTIADDTEVKEIDPTDWEIIYPNTKPMQIGDAEVAASVAETMSERITGLSGTPFLPEDVVKLFVFESPELHSIWMKDMNYALDIIWVDEAGKIVHLEENVAPESFPNFFTPSVPAKYVIETNAGFVSKNGIEAEQVVVLPNL